MPKRRFCLHLLAATALTAPLGVAAQTYPERPIKVVVAFAAGGPTDVLARVVAAGLAQAIGQQVIVENRPGAGGQLGAREAARAKPDGYTLLFAGDAMLTVQPQLQKAPGYDPQADFTPLRLVAAQSNVLAVHAGKGIADLAGLIASAKASPGRLTFGSAGKGSPSHLIGALFQSEAGVDLVHVPYRGAGPAMADLVGGQVDAMFVGMPTALQYAHRPELRLLAVTGDQRHPGLPAVPTFAEAGIGRLGSETSIWWSLMGPAGLPAAVQARLDDALKAALDDAQVRRQLAPLGVEVLNLDAATTRAWMVRDHAKWGALIQAGRISGE